MEYVIEHLTDISRLKDFYCGVQAMDNFIHEGLDMSVVNHYCKAYCMSAVGNEQPIAIFALSFDSLDLDSDDKDDMMMGISVETPDIPFDYKDIFINKSRYPALEIAYLAVDQRYSHQGIGRIIIEEIVKKAQDQELAGCQFLTVEALTLKDHSAVGFYERCGFSPCEYPNPNRDVLRMFRTLYPMDTE